MSEPARRPGSPERTDAAGHGEAATAAPVGRKVTADLLARYDQAGPRYTSYPTAVEFGNSVTVDLYKERLAEANRLAGEPLSIYVHLPFCEERCLFCGCHVIITPHHDRSLPYLDLLAREVELVAERLPDRRGVSQLHLGGGTPTYYRPSEMARMLDHLLRFFHPVEDAELAVECDPRVTTPEHLDTLAVRGFNRISFGVQDFTPKVQEAVGRVQSIEETRALMEHARQRGFRGINVDLIYGLPHQTPKTFEKTVETVIELGADRCAVYSFAFVPWIRGHQKKLMEDALPAREVKFGLFALARERFLRAGYVSIGMDHFALPSDELARARAEHRLRRNFQGYTVIPATDVIGIGISSIGDVRGTYVQNEKKLSRYEEAVTAGELPLERGVMRSADDELRRAVIHELMCNFRVEIAAVEAEFGIDFRRYFAEELKRLEPHRHEGLVELENGRILATPTGELFIRNIALCFDRYWWEKHADDDHPVFSRTV
jgi:oxygen-independent coproporphyrinogen-3 oxidase